jgi:hypothetical protein
MDAKALGLHSLLVASATIFVAGNAAAEETGGPPPPSQPAVGVSLGGSASAEGPTASNPAADQGSTSTSAARDAGDKNPANYEFAFISVGANQAWNLAGDWLFFGAGGGVGPPLYRYSKMKEKTASGVEIDHDAGWNANLDIVYGNLFLRIAPVRYVDIDFGPKIAIGATLFEVQGAPESAFSYGGYADLRVGSPKVKFGPRFEYMKIAHSNFYETGWILTPLMVRVVP